MTLRSNDALEPGATDTAGTASSAASASAAATGPADAKASRRAPRPCRRRRASRLAPPGPRATRRCPPGGDPASREHRPMRARAASGRAISSTSAVCPHRRSWSCGRAPARLPCRCGHEGTEPAGTVSACQSAQRPAGVQPRHGEASIQEPESFSGCEPWRACTPAALGRRRIGSRPARAGAARRPRSPRRPH